MSYLIAISLVAFCGAVFMLLKRASVIAPHVEAAGHHARTNFILDFLRVMKFRVREAVYAGYMKALPYVHELAAAFASKMYKMSSWLAREFLKFYNFIQGRKVLKNSGNTSIFIRDIASAKGRGRI